MAGRNYGYGDRAAARRLSKIIAARVARENAESHAAVFYNEFSRSSAAAEGASRDYWADARADYPSDYGEEVVEPAPAKLAKPVEVK